jgi:N-acetyl-gamma-glutamyl-phosphate reductase
MKIIKVGVIGGAGYTGGELIRILINHSNVSLKYVHSKSNAGKLISDIHPDLLGDTELRFTDVISSDIDVAFLCVGHGESLKIIEKFEKDVKIIDLSQDFRLNSPKDKPFVYGLPELNKDLIKESKNISNPGCFATVIQLALLPLANRNQLNSKINITATTGSTGSGKSLSEHTHFSWRQNNLSAYKMFTHQHLSEITMSIKQLQANFNSTINLIPQRGSFTRGIFSTIVITSNLNIDELNDMYIKYYKKHPFVRISSDPIDLKQVINTNKCYIYLEKFKDELLIIGIIDNLLKGACGQAVQNMNLMFGLDETKGLKLKALAF